MTNTQTLLLLPGDGIGPEVTEEARRVAVHVAPDLQIDSAFFGGVSYDQFGTPLTDEVMAQARKSDAILMGAVGGPKWDNVPRDKRPEAALLRMRKELDVYANLRPAFCFPSLAGASALKKELVEGLDIMIVRELTSGVYFGQPKTIETMSNGERRGIDTASYTTSEIRRVAARAFELARGRVRNSKFAGVLSCEKSNVMESGLLWRQEVTRLHAEQYGDVKLDHMLADAAAMHLVKGAERHQRPARRQPVRRHSLGRSLDADRLDRHAAVSRAGRSGRAGPLRAGARFRPRYRRQGHRQSDRCDPVARNADALEPRSR